MFALVALWLALALLVGAAALPLVAWCVPDWPDRGASLALPAGLAVLTLVGYWVGQVAFGPPVAVVALAALLGAGLLAQRHGPGAAPRRARAPLAVFAATFLLFVAVRALDPAITPYGGEQFLDFGLIHAVRRTPALPPEDIWFAGAPLRYYYGGPLLTGLLTWLTDTPPRYAYNLTLPLVFGALATAAFGLARAVAAASDHPPRLAGALGVLLVAFSGPLATPVRALSSYLPRSLVAEYGTVLYGGVRMSEPAVVDAVRYLAGDGFNPWLGRYVIPNAPTVFPFWTFQNGDLRPHMYAGPFLLLGVALVFAYYRTPAERLARRRALAFGALPAVGGLLALVNTWDLPTLAGVAWLAFAFGAAPPATLFPAAVTSRLPDAGGLRAELQRTVVAGGAAVAVAALAAVWAAPYLLFHTAETRGVAFPGPASGLGGLLLVYGGFLAVFLLAFGPSLPDWDRRRWAVAAAVLAGALAGTVAVGRAALALFGPLVLVGWWLARTGRERGFAVVLLVGGAGLVLVTELAYARVWPYSAVAPRWNTVYKVTLQVWALWGVAAAVGAARVLGRAREVVADRDLRGALPVAAVAVVLLGAIVFPAFALATTFDEPVRRGPSEVAWSLNGTARMGDWHPGRVAAGRWLRANTTGQPNIVSKPANAWTYTWDGGANVYSVLSGVPTLAGWEHAAGYHGREAYYRRVARAEAVYRANWSAARATLLAFDVAYVVQGPAETAAYGDWDHADRPGISVAYRNPTVTVYAVDRSALE